MAEKLLKLYKFVSDNGGLTSKVKLAQLTKISSTVAATAPDSPENITMFKKAIKEITGMDAPSV